MAKGKTKKPKKSYRITLVCRKANPDNAAGTLTTAEEVSTSSFKCPACKQTLVYLPKENRLSAHGQQIPGSDKKAPPPDHELRKVIELSAKAKG